MRINCTIDEMLQRVVMKLPESFTITDITNAIDESIRNPAFRPNFDILSDHSDVVEPISVQVAKQMISHLEGLSQIFAGTRWAVVAPNAGSFGTLRMVAAHAERVPMEVQVFRLYEEAEAWLAESKKE